MIWIPVVIVSLAGLSLFGPPAAWKGKDPMVHRGSYKPERVEYRSWISSGNVDRQTGTCTFTVFALATREQLTRLRINGQEQLLDWSWSWEAKVPEGHHASGMIIEFIDPISGKIVATHDVWARCPWKNEALY